ncbi:Tn3 family transposase [Microbispora sp. NBC_01189]|nr:Tn3 family transposase [Microbispora sp. NBC_01189]
MIDFVALHIDQPSFTGRHTWNFVHPHYTFNTSERDPFIDGPLTPGQARFQDAIEQIFRRTGIAFTLGSDMRVHRLGPPEARTLISHFRPNTNDPELDVLLGDAVSRFLSRVPADRQDALEKLWDGFERLKTLELGGQKSNSIARLLDNAAPEPFRTEINSEFKALTDIGNQFRIRHHEHDRHAFPNDAAKDYVFIRCVSLIAHVLRQTGRMHETESDPANRTHPAKSLCNSTARRFRSILSQESANPRASGNSVMIYWHVERKNVCIYSQLKSCSSSEVAAMIEELLRLSQPRWLRSHTTTADLMSWSMAAWSIRWRSSVISSPLAAAWKVFLGGFHLISSSAGILRSARMPSRAPATACSGTITPPTETSSAELPELLVHLRQLVLDRLADRAERRLRVCHQLGLGLLEHVGGGGAEHLFQQTVVLLPGLVEFLAHRVQPSGLLLEALLLRGQLPELLPELLDLGAEPGLFGLQRLGGSSRPPMRSARRSAASAWLILSAGCPGTKRIHTWPRQDIAIRSAG